MKRVYCIFAPYIMHIAGSNTCICLKNGFDFDAESHCHTAPSQSVIRTVVSCLQHQHFLLAIVFIFRANVTYPPKWIIRPTTHDINYICFTVVFLPNIMNMMNEHSNINIKSTASCLQSEIHKCVSWFLIGFICTSVTVMCATRLYN